MKIAVYSGSFNPLHIGHLAIMKHLTSSCGFDMVYLIVSPKNPIKSSISADTGMARYLAARETVKKYPELRVTVDDIELHMPAPQYTINTLDALKKREPENDFTLVIGADNLENIRRWKDYRKILCNYGVAVYPRKGFDMVSIKQQLEAEAQGEMQMQVQAQGQVQTQEQAQAQTPMHESELPQPYRVELLDAPIIDISSTEIRLGMQEGRDMSKWMI